MSAPTRVFITVDVECAEERPRHDGYSAPVGDDLRIWGRFSNQPRELGISLIMDELEHAGHRGTFFVEPLASHWIGIDRLAAICTEIRRRGHDVQLHLHPVLRQPRWMSRGQAVPGDDIGSYPLAEQVAQLTEGIELLERAGVPRESVVGFRAGNFGADNRTWQALARVGLKVSSNYNPCALGKGCRINWRRREIEAFDTGVGVVELPISTFPEPGGRMRPLQITAVSIPEMTHYLREARKLGIGEVTVVTHPFELFYIDSVSERRGRPNRINRLRLRGLCRFLERYRDDFEVCTVRRLAEHRRPETSDSLPLLAVPSGRRALRLGRLAEQAVKRLDAQFGVW